MQEILIDKLHNMDSFKVVKNTNFTKSVLNQKHKRDFGYENVSDIKIWEEFKSGNENAFNYIYFVYYNALFNYGHQFSLNRELIKDVIQDLFIELRIKRQNLPVLKYSIKAYLFKSVRNKILKSKKHTFIYINEDEAETKGFDLELSIEDIIIKKEIDDQLLKKLNQAIEKLTKRQREILVYYYYEKLSYEEITSIMGFSKIEHARVLVSRSIKKLKEEMQISNEHFFTILFLLSLYNKF